MATLNFCSDLTMDELHVAVRKDDQLILVCLGFSQWSENEVVTDIGNNKF